jgi:hypothetical protein
MQANDRIDSAAVLYCRIRLKALQLMLCITHPDLNISSNLALIAMPAILADDQKSPDRGTLDLHGFNAAKIHRSAA